MYELLIKAIQEKNLKKIQELLHSYKEEKGEKALHTFLNERHEGEPILFSANHFEQIKLFIEYGANFTKKDSKGNTILHSVAKRGLGIVDKLLDEFANTFSYFVFMGPNSEGDDPLLLAAKFGSTADVETILERAGYYIDCKLKEGKTALQLLEEFVVENNQSEGSLASQTLEILRDCDLLLSNEQTIQLQSNKTYYLNVRRVADNNTPLHIALSKTQPNISFVFQLLMKNCHLRAANRQSITPLQLMSRQKHPALLSMGHYYLILSIIQDTALKGSTELTHTNNNIEMGIKYLKESEEPYKAELCRRWGELFCNPIFQKYNLALTLFNQIPEQDPSYIKVHKYIEQLILQKKITVDKTYLEKINQIMLNVNLMEAIEKDELPRLKKLLNEGANIDYRDREGTTPLLLAASYGRKHILHYLLMENPTKAKITERDLAGNTALLLAAHNGSVDTVCYLLENTESDPSEKDNTGMTALLSAILGNELEVTQELLTHPLKQSDINEVDNDGHGALYFASFEGRVSNDTLEILEYLLGKGIYIDQKDINDKTVGEIIRDYIASEKIDFSHTSNKYVMANRIISSAERLIEIAEKGVSDLREVSFIFNNLRNGSIHAKRKVDGNTALHLALLNKNPHVELLARLFENSNTLLTVNNQGQTVLDILKAIKNPMIRSLAFLDKANKYCFSYNADQKKNKEWAELYQKHVPYGIKLIASAQDNEKASLSFFWGEFLYKRGCQNYDFSDGQLMCELLNGVPKNHPNYFKAKAYMFELSDHPFLNLPLDKQAQFKQLYYNELFLECAKENDIARLKQEDLKIAEVNFTDSQGYTALHWATQNGHLRMVKYLLSAYPKLDLDAITREGNSALMLAAQHGHVEILYYFMTLIPIPKCQTWNHKYENALTLAALNGHHESIRVLIQMGCLVHPQLEKPLDKAYKEASDIFFESIESLPKQKSLASRFLSKFTYLIFKNELFDSNQDLDVNKLFSKLFCAFQAFAPLFTENSRNLTMKLDIKKFKNQQKYADYIKIPKHSLWQTINEKTMAQIAGDFINKKEIMELSEKDFNNQFLGACWLHFLSTDFVGKQLIKAESQVSPEVKKKKEELDVFRHKLWTMPKQLNDCIERANIVKVLSQMKELKDDLVDKLEKCQTIIETIPFEGRLERKKNPYRESNSKYLSKLNAFCQRADALYEEMLESEKSFFEGYVKRVVYIRKLLDEWKLEEAKKIENNLKLKEKFEKVSSTIKEILSIQVEIEKIKESIHNQVYFLKNAKRAEIKKSQQEEKRLAEIKLKNETELQALEEKQRKEESAKALEKTQRELERKRFEASLALKRSYIEEQKKNAEQCLNRYNTKPQSDCAEALGWKTRRKRRPKNLQLSDAVYQFDIRFGGLDQSLSYLEHILAYSIDYHQSDACLIYAYALFFVCAHTMEQLKKAQTDTAFPKKTVLKFRNAIYHNFNLFSEMKPAEMAKTIRKMVFTLFNYLLKYQQEGTIALSEIDSKEFNEMIQTPLPEINLAVCKQTLENSVATLKLLHKLDLEESVDTIVLAAARAYTKALIGKYYTYYKDHYAHDSQFHYFKPLAQFQKIGRELRHAQTDFLKPTTILKKAQLEALSVKEIKETKEYKESNSVTWKYQNSKLKTKKKEVASKRLENNLN